LENLFIFLDDNESESISLSHSIHTFSKNNFVFDLSGNLLFVITGNNFYVSFGETLQLARENQVDDTKYVLMIDASSRILLYLIQPEYCFNSFLIVTNHPLFAISSGSITQLIFSLTDFNSPN
jgi:hypothetical protein